MAPRSAAPSSTAAATASSTGTRPKGASASATTGSAGATGQAPRQRGVYSEMLSQGLQASSVDGGGDYTVQDSEGQAVLSASSFIRPSGLELEAGAALKAEFEDKSIEPKVIAPYETRPGQIPRKIEIERKKRLYANQTRMHGTALSLHACLKQRTEAYCTNRCIFCNRKIRR